MATTDRTPMGIAHLTVVPEGFDLDAEEREAEEDEAEEVVDGAGVAVDPIERER